MFRGHYRHTIDTKGRLSIPSRFRDALADGWGDKLVIVPSGKGLDVHPLKSWEELEGRVAALPRLDPDARQFRYSYLSLGQDVLLDPLDDRRAMAPVNSLQVAVDLLLNRIQLLLPLLADGFHIEHPFFPLGKEF